MDARVAPAILGAGCGRHQVIRKIISALFLVGTVLALYNVYADNSEIVRRAEHIACNGSACVRLLRAERTPVRQSFTFQTQLHPPVSRDVHCRRAYYLVGPFDCQAS